MVTPEDRQFSGSLIDSVPFPVFVVDPDIRLVAFNRVASTMVGDNPSLAFSRKSGEALHCIHATEAIGGCGASEACKTCVIRASVGLSARTGEVVRRPQRMQLVGPQGEVRDIYLLIVTSPVADATPPLVMLILQEIGELVSTQGIVPVCMHCGKVRERSDEWASMEQYLKQHLDLDMSHGLCPECLRKHYPDAAAEASP